MSSAANACHFVFVMRLPRSCSIKVSDIALCFPVLATQIHKEVSYDAVKLFGVVLVHCGISVANSARTCICCLLANVVDTDFVT